MGLVAACVKLFSVGDGGVVLRDMQCDDGKFHWAYAENFLPGGVIVTLTSARLDLVPEQVVEQVSLIKGDVIRCYCGCDDVHPVEACLRGICHSAGFYSLVNSYNPV